MLSTGTRGRLFASHTPTWLPKTPHTPVLTCEWGWLASLGYCPPLQASGTDGKTARRHTCDLNSASWMHLHVQRLRFYHPCCSSPRGINAGSGTLLERSLGSRLSFPTLSPSHGVSACGSAAGTALALRAPTIQLLIPECSHGLHKPLPASTTSEGCSHPGTRQGMASKQDAPRRMGIDTFSSSNSLINLNSAQMRRQKYLEISFNLKVD